MTSIRAVLEVIRRGANEYMQNLDRRPDEWVTLTSIVDHDGSVNEAAQGKVVMTLFNVARENVISTYTPARPGGDQYAIVAPPLYVNLHVAFMANFFGAHYADGLGALTRILEYFQQNPVFTHANTPDLGPDVDRIMLEMENYAPNDVNYVMGMLGTKYLPSVFYKLRLLSFASSALQARTYPASGSGVSESPGSTA